MIQLLFTVLLVEAALILAFLFKTNIVPELFLEALDAFKQGKGPLILRIVAGTLLALLLSSVYSVLQILRRPILAGSIDLPDQILLSGHMLQATLAGILLFLGVVIDRLHPLIREESSLKNTIKAENTQFQKRKLHIETQLKAFKNEIVKLKPKITKLELEHLAKTKKAVTAEITASALKKQAEMLYIEYDRLLDYNQTLRNQLQSIDEVLLKDKETTGSSNFENELVTRSRCDVVLFSGSSPTASPRHRRPIYQH